jgi:peptide/nickel transport system permease protein
MRAYIIRRLLAVPLMLIGMSFILFMLLWIRPGSAAFAHVGGAAGEFGGDIKAFEKTLGLDRPWFVQYADWSWSALRGDFGTSLVPPRRSVSSLITERVWNTVQIGLMAVLLGSLVGIPAGILSSVKRNSPLDYGVRVLTISGISIPSFWTATLLLTLPAMWWGWTPLAREFTEFTENPVKNLGIVIWPALILAYGQAAYTARIVRSSMLEVFYSDYVRTARAKGLGERAVVFGHVFRNSLVTVLTVIGLQLATILGGAVIAEQIFAIPGIGLLTFQAILADDYPVVLATITIFCFMFLIINLLVDVLYTVVDPRIRY